MSLGRLPVACCTESSLVSIPSVAAKAASGAGSNRVIR
jgi:hypothetical protein